MVGAAFRRRQAQFLSSSFAQHQHYVIDQHTLVLNEWTFSEIFHQNIRVCVIPGSSLHHRRSFLPCCNPIAQLVSCSWAPALGTRSYQVPTRPLPSCSPHFRSFALIFGLRYDVIFETRFETSWLMCLFVVWWMCRKELNLRTRGTDLAMCSFVTRFPFG